MPKSLLDTDILSEYLKGHDANVVRHAVRYHQQYGIFTFTSVTVHEVVFGLELKGAASQLNKALLWFRQNEEVPPAPEDYFRAAKMKADARRSGAVLELPDCLIAAIAARLGLPIVTGNTADFEKIQRTGVALKLENWRNP
jgi:predicted nucleic acid-binding protein